MKSGECLYSPCIKECNLHPLSEAYHSCQWSNAVTESNNLSPEKIPNIIK
jgi:hypothetical protein